MSFAVLFTIVVTSMVMFLLKSDLAKSLIAGLVVFALTIGVALLTGVADYMFILFFATAAMATTSNFSSMLEYLPGRWRSMGGQLTHFGFGIMLVGVLGSSAFVSSEKLVLPEGVQGEAFGLKVTYIGMANDIMTPLNKLILEIDNNGDVYEANPMLYYSAKLDGLMKKPYIEKSLLQDLYFSPEDIREGQGPDGLHLEKGETRTVGEYEITFADYEMGSHSDQAQEMVVTANLFITQGDNTEVVIPSMTMGSDDQGNRTETSIPDTFGANGEHEVHIEQIMADDGSVVLRIPGMTDEMRAKSRLVIDVSRKPIINLVWLGTTIILLGGLVAIIRRRSELPV
jgi:cytochrome c-type biogenesis protein CcmF